MADDRRSIGVRVRPNSHDFIRHLRADLATKKYTFYVDVGAKTHQATTDVRAWANGALQKIHASIPVHANTGQASKDVADWRRRQAGFKTVIPVHADTTAAKAEIEALRAMVKDITVNVRAETSRARADMDRVARSRGPRGGSTGSGLPKKNVDKEFADALAKSVEQVNKQWDTLDAKVDKTKKKAKEKVQTKYELDMEEAERDLLKLKLKTKADKLKVPVDFGTGDIAGMKLALARLRITEQARKIELNVEIKRSASDRLFKTMREMEKRMGSLTVVRSLDFGPLNLGKPSGLAGTLSTITLLAGAVPAAVTGIAALSDALIRLAGAAALVPGAIGGLLASIATITVGTQGVGEAFSAMFDMWNEGASEQEASAAALISTHDAYANAVKDEAKAQEDVGRARREALGDLRDLNNELRGAVLNEAQAILDVQKARAEYAKGASKGGLEEQQLRLNVYKSEQGLIDLRERNIDLGQRATEGQAKGIEGSDKVRNALDAQTQAAQATAKALTALEKAQSGGRSSVSKFADELAQLSPNARDFVETIAGMKDEMLGFRNALQDTLFQGAGPAFKDMFDALMPTIGPGMQGIAKEMNKNLLQVFDTLKSPEGESIIDRILGGTADAQKAIGRLINPMVLSIGRLTAAGTEHLPQLIDLFTQLFTRFDAFLKRAEDSGALDKFMDEGIDALSDLAEIGINVIEILHQFSKAFRDSFGEDVLSMLARLTGQFAKFLGDAEGQKKINDYIQEAKDLWAQWKPILEDLPRVFKSVSDAATLVLQAALPVIREIADFMKNNPLLVKSFIAAWLGSKLLLGAFTPIWKLFKGIKTLVTEGTVLVGKLAEAVRKIPNIPGLPGGNKTLTTPGNTPPIAAAAPKSGLAAAATTAAAALPFLGLTVGFATIANELLKDEPEIKGNPQARGRAGIAGGIKATPGIEVVRGGVDANAAPLPNNIPQPGTREALAGVKQGAINNNPAALWIQGAADAADWKKRYIFAATHPETAGNPFAPPDSYMSGGYTNWGQGAGYPAILHGKEYVQPADTVSHYGVDAMKAVHEKKAAISFGGGGMAPMANPNYGWGPGNENRRGRRINERGGTGDGWWAPPDMGPSSGGWQLGPWGGSGGIGWQLGKSPFRPLPQRKKRIHMFGGGGMAPMANPNWDQQPGPYPGAPPGIRTWIEDPITGRRQFPAPGGDPGQGGVNIPGWREPGIGGGIGRSPFKPMPKNPIKSFQEGGYFDATGRWVDPADPRTYVPHGSAQPAPAPTGGGSLADVLSQGISSGIGAAGNVVDFATSLVQGAGQGQGAPGSVLDIATGATPGGPAPGPAAPGMAPTPGTPGFTTGSPFGDSFLGALGIPGLGGNGQQDIGPGWPGGSAPVGLGGSPGVDPATGLPTPGLDIRNFGIGPGPPGSGPADWAMFAGQTLGKFGSGIATSFMSGILGFFGISGISSDSLLGGALGIGGHFLGAPGLAGQDDNLPANADVEAALDTYADMPTNPDYPGVPNLPDVIDMNTGQIVGGKKQQGGLQINTARGKAIIEKYFPWATNIGGVRPDALRWHPDGLALDVMIPGQKGNNDPTTPEGLALGNQLHAWLQAHAKELGIDYMMWQEKDHYNHIHVNFSPSGFGAGGSNWGNWQVPSAPGFDVPGSPPVSKPPPPQRASGEKLPPPPKPPNTINLAPMEDLLKGTHDQGGWLMPGVSVVSNMTGKPELVIPSFIEGGQMPTGVLPYRPRPPDIMQKVAPRPTPPPAPTGPPPATTPPAVVPPTPPPSEPGKPPPPGVIPPTAPGPGGGAIGGPSRPATGVGPEEGSHVHPALKKGIASAANTLGSLAAMAVNTGMAAATFGASGAAGAAAGAAGGSLGGFVQGLFQQGGKIVEDIANVGSSFLVGNITGGTTENPYGVTQRGMIPSGGTKVVNASTNHFGDITTNNLDEYMKVLDRREAQKAQSGLGRWGNA